MSHSAQVELLEQGLGLHRTKLGSNEKETAYAIKQTRFQAFAVGVCVTLFMLATLSGVFISLYDSERIARVFAHQKIADEKHDAVRLAFALHHQEAEQDEQQRDSIRMLKRITSKIEHTFQEHFDPLPVTPDLRAQIAAVKAELVAYVAHELKDFKQEVNEMESESQKRLKKLSLMQEMSMRELLTTMSGLKLEELDSMLEKVFRSAETAPEIIIAESDIDDLENLADSVFGEIVSLEEGERKFAEMRSKIKGIIPKDIEARLAAPMDPDDWAECLNELCEYARLSSGRKQIMQIKAEFDKRLGMAIEQDEQAPGPDGAPSPEVAATVDAVIQLHKLVSEGKVPFHLLDFEALDMDIMTNDENAGAGNNQDEDGNGAQSNNENGEQPNEPDAVSGDNNEEQKEAEADAVSA